MLPLPQNCDNCKHWDGDKHCALPMRPGSEGYRPDQFCLIFDGISRPKWVVCAMHEAKEADRG